MGSGSESHNVDRKLAAILHRMWVDGVVETPNLPWVVEQLEQNDPARLHEWVHHWQTQSWPSFARAQANEPLPRLHIHHNQL
jgi:hypothetical protein